MSVGDVTADGDVLSDLPAGYDPEPEPGPGIVSHVPVVVDEDGVLPDPESDPTDVPYVNAHLLLLCLDALGDLFPVLLLRTWCWSRLGVG